MTLTDNFNLPKARKMTTIIKASKITSNLKKLIYVHSCMFLQKCLCVFLKPNVLYNWPPNNFKFHNGWKIWNKKLTVTEIDRASHNKEKGNFEKTELLQRNLIYETLMVNKVE